MHKEHEVDTHLAGDTSPAFVSVETAAKYLGISRAMAYQQAHQHLTHGGGLHCVRLGTRLLVPIAWLHTVAGVAVDSTAGQ